MTVGLGHPDYQDYANWRSLQISSGAFSITSVAPIQVNEYVTNWASTNIFVQLLTGTGITVTITFYEDSSLAIVAGSYTWILSGVDCLLSVIVPNLGNYISYNVTTIEAGTQTGNSYIAPMNIGVSAPRYQGEPNVQDGNSVAIGAGTTQTVQLPYVTEGDGYAFVLCGFATAPFTVEIDSLLESGATRGVLAKLSSVMGNQSLSFIASAYPTAFKITNNDSVSRNFAYHCQVLGR